MKPRIHFDRVARVWEIVWGAWFTGSYPTWTRAMGRVQEIYERGGIKK